MLFFEDKELILSWLLHTLNCTIAGMTLTNIAYKQLDDGEELAILIFDNGYRKTVNISADSGKAMIQDILRAL